MQQNPIYFTHPGVIHADETAGCATLLIADMVSGFDRSGDISKARFGVDFISDTGGVYNAIHRKFDHHQTIIRRENGVPMAAFGLIWKHYGRTAVARVLNYADYLEGIEDAQTTMFINNIADRVDLTLVQGVDAADADNAYKLTATCSADYKGTLTEVRPTSISGIISMYNADDVRDANAQEQAFQQAVELWQYIITASIESAAKFVTAKNDFQPRTIQDGKILVLDKFMPWQEIVEESYTNALFIIYPGSQSPINLQAVPVKAGNRELKQPIERPEWFTGFIHQGKFIAGCQDTEEAIKLAEAQLI